MSTYTLHDDPPRITCHRCGLTSHHPDDVRHHYCAHCHLFHPDEGMVSLAQWRYAIGHRVRWAGDPEQTYTITSRRWVERQIMAPYAEYQITRSDGGTIWVVEADLADLAATKPPRAGEGGG